MHSLITILSMPALFLHLRTKYMVAPALRKITFFVWFLMWFCKIYNLNSLPQYLHVLKSFSFLVQNALLYANGVSITYQQPFNANISVIQHLFEKPHKKYMHMHTFYFHRKKFL